MRPIVVTNSISQGQPVDAGDNLSPVRRWLACVAVLLVIMVAVGGATRLTDSGLSITEWQPIMGAIPPLSSADWQVAFEKYKLIPEYQVVNKGMSLAEFQTIYWWEWAHRLMGRLIGIAFAVPLAVFWFRGLISRSLSAWLFGILALGGLQGFVGWYMVASGLSERTDVSQYRLALHLGLAVLLFGALVWTLLVLSNRLAGTGSDPMASTPLRPWSRAGDSAKGFDPFLLAMLMPALIFLQIILGAFVAGLDAGLSHTTWPLMDGAFVPSGLFAMQPWWLNLFENVATVQFNHRMLAYGLLLLAVINAALSPVRSLALALLAGVLLQAGLGIWTLLALVPVHLGVAHQVTAVLLFGLGLWHLHRVRRGLQIAKS